MIAPGRPLDLDQLREIISEEMPWIVEPDKLQVLGFGFRSIAVETASGEVVLIGKIADTAATFRRIFHVAPHLRRHLPASIPRPAWHLPSNDRLPGGALGYPKLPGRPLEMADIEGPARGRIVVALAGFLEAFHRFPVEQARTLGVPYVGKPDWAGTVEAVLPALSQALSPPEYEVIDGW